MPDHYSKSFNRHEEEAKAGRVFDRVWQQRNTLLNALLGATARFGAAADLRERQQHRKAVKEALAAFNKVDLDLFGVVGAEDSLRTGQFLQEQLRKHGRAGSQWSTDKREGYTQAMHRFQDWVRYVVDHAKAVAEIPRVAGKPVTVGEREANTLAEKERLVAENKTPREPQNGERR